jgi:hypothetical protein
VDDDAVVVWLEDAAMLLAPEPHIPVNPDVASIPEVVDTPDVADIADDVDGLPGVAAVAGIVSPAIPPPSYVVRDPNVPSGEVATVEHAEPLLAFGTVIVPVKPLSMTPTPCDVVRADRFSGNDSKRRGDAKRRRGRGHTDLCEGGVMARRRRYTDSQHDGGGSSDFPFHNDRSH